MPKHRRQFTTSQVFRQEERFRVVVNGEEASRHGSREDFQLSFLISVGAIHCTCGVYFVLVDGACKRSLRSCDNTRFGGRNFDG